MIKDTASQKVGAQLINASDGSSFTGAVTVYVTLDAGAQAIGSVGGGACTHEGNGYHTYAPAQAETNGDLVGFTFIGTGAVSQTVQIYTRLAAPDVGNVTGNVTGSVGSIAAAGISAASLAAAAKSDIADYVLDRNMATGTDSGTDSTAVRTTRQALRILRNKTTIAAGVATVKKEDDSTTSWTAAVATTAGDPISGVDPT